MIAERLQQSTHVLNAASQVQIKMAKVIVTLKIMPQSPEVDLGEIEKKAKQKIIDFAGETETKTEIVPIAFGLKALNLMFVMDEEKGSTDFLETQVKDLDNVNSAEVTDVRRAIG